MRGHCLISTTRLLVLSRLEAQSSTTLPKRPTVYPLLTVQHTYTTVYPSDYADDDLEALDFFGRRRRCSNARHGKQ